MPTVIYLRVVSCEHNAEKRGKKMKAIRQATEVTIEAYENLHIYNSTKKITINCSNAMALMSPSVAE